MNILLLCIICTSLIVIYLIIIKLNYTNNKLNETFNKKQQLTTKDIEYINSFVKVNDKKENFNIVITVICCMENDYINEWLDFHLNKLGIIDHIYLYINCENFCYNNEIINNYINRNLLTIINFTHIEKKNIGLYNRKPQYFSLIHNYNNFKNKYILHIDIDEFLIIYDKNKFLKTLENNIIGNFKINRYDFSGDNKITKQNNVINSYFYREKKPSSYKSIARYSNIVKKINDKNNIMDYLAEDNYIGSCHEFFTNLKSEYISSDICKINHYKLKSLEEYLIRPISNVRKSNKEEWKKLNEKLYQIKDDDIISLYYKNI
jgi:hypothetical protein